MAFTRVIRTAPVIPQPVCFDTKPPGRWAWAPVQPDVPITDLVTGGNAVCSWWAYDTTRSRHEEDAIIDSRYCPIARPDNAKVGVYQDVNTGRWMWKVEWKEPAARVAATSASSKHIYLASSWRNQAQPALVQAIRAAGHEVYDFKNPSKNNTGFSWSQVDPNYKDWTPDAFRKALAHPVSQLGFAHDYGAMQWADTFVLLLPCGKSAHLELGWALGRGVPSYVLMPEKDEPELMYLLGATIVTSTDELLAALAGAPAAVQP